MKRVVILTLCLLLVFSMAMPCFATDAEETETYGVGHAGGQVDATYDQSGADNGISMGAVIGIAGGLIVVVCAAVLYLKKKRC